MPRPGAHPRRARTPRRPGTPTRFRRGPPPHRLARRRAAGLVMALVVMLIATVTTAGGAGASWPVTTTPDGETRARSQGMTGGQQPAAAAQPSTGDDVDVCWSPSTGGPAAGYEVFAYDADTDAPRAVGGTCDDLVTGTSCTDTDAPDGRWTYSVRPRSGEWAGTESVPGDPLWVDTVVPVITIDFPEPGGAYNAESWDVVVANHNGPSVTPITVSSRAAGTAITLGAGAAPHGVAVAPDGVRAYVSNEGLDRVTPITVATRTAGTTIAVGDGPNGIAVVPDQAPVATFTVTPGTAGSPVAFNAAASTVAYGTIASYFWDFGDGATATTSSPATTHTYAAGGNYTASVTETSSGGTSTTRVFTGQTVSRNGGSSATTTRPVTVSGPTVAMSFPAVDSTYGTTSWNAGCTSSICGTSTSTSTANGAGVIGVEISVRQGIGNYWNGTAFASATEVLLDATGTTSWTLAFPATNFTASGAYTVRAVATDANANTATTSKTTTIDKTAPVPSTVVFFNANGTINGGITGDEVRITYSEPIEASSICSTWSGTGNQTLGGSGVVVTVIDQASNDTVAATSAGCIVHIGTITTGLQWVTSNATFSGTSTNESRITWTAATNLLTIHLGVKTSAPNPSTNAGTGTADYTPHASLTDRYANPISTTPFNSTTQRF